MGRKKSKIKRKRPALSIAFFLTGILVISLNLMLSNCGDSKQKSIISDGGPFAIDLSLTDAGKVGAVILVNSNKNLPSLDGTEFTVEAWVKSKTTSLNGGIFARLTSFGGIALYVKDNIPKFTSRHLSGPTSSDYIVESADPLITDIWYHIAGVLTIRDHSGSGPGTCAAIGGLGIPVGSEAPHLEIYINGELKACKTTWGDPNDSATGPQFAAGTGTDESAWMGRLLNPIDGLADGNFDGIIDEVRSYRIAKTEAEINTTMNRELNNGEIASVDLIGYWRNNVGKGSLTTEYTGGSYNGSIYQCNPGATPAANDPACVIWDSSWVDGYPF